MDGAICLIGWSPRRSNEFTPVWNPYQRAQPTNNYALDESGDGSNGAMKAFYTGVASLGWFVVIGPLFLALIWSLFMKLAAWKQGLAKRL
jgi:hypothetical protein